jgi:hypothetical protein
VKFCFWTRGDYDDRKSFFEDELGGGDAYPKSAAEAMRELVRRGIDANTDDIVEYVLDPARMARFSAQKGAAWHKPDIDDLAEQLYKKGRVSHHVRFCQVANLRFGQVVSAYMALCALRGQTVCLPFRVAGAQFTVYPAEGNPAKEFGTIAFKDVDEAKVAL